MLLKGNNLPFTYALEKKKNCRQNFFVIGIGNLSFFRFPTKQFPDGLFIAFLKYRLLPYIIQKPILYPFPRQVVWLFRRLPHLANS